MVEVEILGQVITHQYGTLNTGDTLRTSLAFAKHLVEDCGAAKYRGAPPVEKVEDPAAPVVAPADGVQDDGTEAALAAPRRGRSKQ